MADEQNMDACRLNRFSSDRRGLRSPNNAEEGQALVLAIGLCALALVTISVVMAVSAVNMKARQLLAVADGAVVAAVDEFDFVAVGGAPKIQLTTSQVRHGVERYVADIKASNRIDNLDIRSIHILPGGQGAELVLAGSVDPPIVGWIVPSGIPIEVTASAQTVLSR